MIDGFFRPEQFETHGVVFADVEAVNGGVGKAVVLEGRGKIIGAGIVGQDEITRFEQRQRAFVSDDVAGEAARTGHVPEGLFHPA